MPPRRLGRSSLHRQLAVAIVVLTVLAAVGAAFRGRHAPPEVLARVVCAVGLGAGVGLILGLVQHLVSQVLLLLARGLELDAWWARVNSRDRAAPREPGVSFRAWACAGVPVAAGFGAAVWLLMPRLLDIADASFARSFAVLVFVALVGAAGLGWSLAARLLTPLIARLDRRLALPWPASPVLRYLLFVAIPLAASLPGYLIERKDELGAFALPFWLVVVIAGEGLVALSWAALRPRERHWLVGAIVPGLALVACVASSVTLNRSPATARWVDDHAVLRPMRSVLNTLTDLDRDGFSSLFGAGDCAPFDPARNPLATDTPENGVDEDCSGADAELAPADELERFSGVYQRPEGAPPPNIVFVVADAIRADHTKVGGAKQSVTPFLDEISEVSLLFTRAYSQSSATMMSLPSMLSGRDPSMVDWVRGERIEFADYELTLAARLGELGYHTMIMGAGYLEVLGAKLDDFEDQQIVDHYPKARYREPGGAYFRGRAPASVVAAIQYLEWARESDEPVFLSLYLPGAHEPYWQRGFDFDRHGKSKAARYKAEVAATDTYVGFLIHYLQHSGQWDNTVFVFVSDHGEEFGEHGGKEHSRTCYAESVHVPLIVHIPGIEGDEIDVPVGPLDIAPTILEVVGATDDPDDIEGQSLLIPALAPDRVPEQRPIPCAIISQRRRQGNFFRRAARTRDGVLIHNVLEGSYEYYDTREDPGEQVDRHDELEDTPEVVALREFLRDSLHGTLPQTLMTN